MFYVNLPLRQSLLFGISYIFLQVLVISSSCVYGQSSREKFEKVFVEEHAKYNNIHADLKHTSLTSSGPLATIAHQINEAKYFSQVHDSVNVSSNSLFDKAIVDARSFADDGVLVFTLSQRGYYYYGMRKLALARPDFMEVILLLDRSPKLVPAFPAEVYKQLGYFLGGIKDYSNGTKFLTKSLDYTVKDDERAAIYDNLGIYALNMGNLDLARTYLDQAWKSIVALNNPVRKAKILGNFACLETQKGDIGRAIELWAEDITISRKNDADLNTLFASNKIADLLIDYGRLQEAQDYLLAIKPFADRHERLVVHRKELNELLLKIAIGRGNEKEEVRIRRLLAMMQDSLNLFDGDFVNEQTKWLTEKAIINEDLRKASLSYDTVKSRVVYSLLAVIFLVSIGLIFVWKYIQERRQGKLFGFGGILGNMTRNSSSLNTTDPTADYRASLIIDKKNNENGLACQLRRVLAEMLLEAEGGDILGYLTTDEAWAKFKHRFILEYPDIYENIELNFPDVSGGSLRVVLLWKLKFNMRESAQLLGISVDAVKKSKQRLRKKMGDERYQQLVDYLEL